MVGKFYPLALKAINASDFNPDLSKKKNFFKYGILQNTVVLFLWKNKNVQLKNSNW